MSFDVDEYVRLKKKEKKEDRKRAKAKARLNSDDFMSVKKDFKRLKRNEKLNKLGLTKDVRKGLKKTGNIAFKKTKTGFTKLGKGFGRLADKYDDRSEDFFSDTKLKGNGKNKDDNMRLF